MDEIIEMTASPEQAESIASHIILILIRDLNITEISSVRVTFGGIDNLEESRINEIVVALSEFNADQIMRMANIDLAEHR